MIPGRITRVTEETLASAATIAPKSDFVRVTGTAEISTIVPPFAGFSGVLFISPAAAFTMTTSGNIAKAVTAVPEQLIVMVYSKENDKWYPSY